jgi:hypothetical protein
MKPLLAAIAIISLLTSGCTAQPDSAKGRKHYPVKSCRIVFKFFNGPQSGTKTVIFDEWGNKEKEEVVTMTGAAKENILILTVASQRYIMDLDQHTGAKSPAKFLFGGSLEENMKQMGFTFVRTDTLVGKPCKVWERPRAFRLWIWNNCYVVKKKMIQDLPGGMRVEEYATEIDDSYSIKPDEFKIPDNIKFQ